MLSPERQIFVSLLLLPQPLLMCNSLENKVPLSNQNCSRIHPYHFLTLQNIIRPSSLVLESVAEKISSQLLFCHRCFLVAETRRGNDVSSKGTATPDDAAVKCCREQNSHNLDLQQWVWGHYLVVSGMGGDGGQRLRVRPSEKMLHPASVPASILFISERIKVRLRKVNCRTRFSKKLSTVCAAWSGKGW